MMLKTKELYLTDITTSEGNLSRLSLICDIIAKTKAREPLELFRLIEAKAHLTNYKVIGRHLYILRTIRLVTKTPEST